MIAAPESQFFEGNSTNTQVLRAAMVQFAAHGYQRTSMENIAREALVSRPTLYSYFKNKQAILRAVSQGIHDSVLENIETALRSEQDLESRLLLAFESWSAPFQGILFGSPHGAELIGVGSSLAADISIDAREKFAALLGKALKTAMRDGLIDLKRTSQTSKSAAEFLILCLNGLSSDETDAKSFRLRLKTLISLFLTANSLQTNKR